MFPLGNATGDWSILPQYNASLWYLLTSIALAKTVKAKKIDDQKPLKHELSYGIFC
jgi:hypothetical protein